MAVGIPVIKVTARNIVRGLRIISGRMTLSANSSFAASGIERYFRRCDNVTVDNSDTTESAVDIQYAHSMANKYGMFICKGISGVTKVSTAVTAYKMGRCPVNNAPLSCAFTAFGSR